MSLHQLFEVGDRVVLDFGISIGEEHVSPGVVHNWLVVNGERKYEVHLDTGVEMSWVHPDWLSPERIALPSPDPLDWAVAAALSAEEGE